MRNEALLILNRLLDKYERSVHLKKPGSSPRRVLLQTHQGDLPEYELEDVDIRDRWNAAVRYLHSLHLIGVTWLPGSDEKVVRELWLLLEELEQSYALAERVPLDNQLRQAVQVIGQAATQMTNPSIKELLRSEARWLEEKRQLGGIVRNGIAPLQDLLTGLLGYDGLGEGGISMRAFSIQCYHNSKQFEQTVRGAFLSFMRKASPALLQAVQQQELSERDQLAFLGIYPRPEVYEMVGPIRLRLSGGWLDFAVFGSHGGALVGTLVPAIEEVDAQRVSRVLFIENKTNYDEYLLREYRSGELVFYHGGFLSPQKRLLVAKLLAALPANNPVELWSDIDMGGFKMFDQLRQLVVTLQPYRMGVLEIERYWKFGFKRSGAYLRELAALKQDDRYSLFFTAIDALLEHGVTIEQEIMLEEA